MPTRDPIQNMRITAECKLVPGLSREIIVPLLYGKSFPTNRCENAAGLSPLCTQCAEAVNARAEQLYLSLPDPLKP